MSTLPRTYRNRHGTYYFGITQNGVKHRFSLNTKDYKRAKIQSLAINLYIEMSDKKFIFDLDKIRKLDIEISQSGVNLRNVEEKDLDVVEKLLEKLGMTNSQFFSLPIEKVANALATGSPDRKGVPKKSKKISEVAELYLNEAKIDNVPKTLYDKRRIYDEFLGFYQDKDINEYTQEEAVSYKNRLLANGTGASVINTKMSYMRMLFLYAINNNLYFSENPFSNVKISTKSKLKKTVRSYKDFTDNDLKIIFEEVAYKNYMNKPDYYWLPLLGLFTGARLEELASLKLEQIVQEDGIWIFEIEEAKNSNSKRKIPIHRRILEESNFLSYLKDLQDKNEPMLFPNRKHTKNGYSKSMSRRFGEYLDLREIKDDRKVFHSFRTTLINRMTNMSVHPALIMSIVGHYEQSKVDFSSAHFSNYQQKKPLEVLKQVIDKLDYPIDVFH